MTEKRIAVDTLKSLVEAMGILGKLSEILEPLEPPDWDEVEAQLAILECKKLLGLDVSKW
jgi:hypothetical protein